MRTVTNDEGSGAHFDGHDLIAEQGLLCWPSNALGNFYFSFPNAMRMCLGLDSATEARPQLIELNEMYELNKDAEAFLAKNNFLIELLNEAAPHLRDVFGDPVRARLELSIDPDHGTDRELFAYVLTNLPARDSVSLLDHFDNDWWFEASSRSKCLLNFSLRYIKDAL